MRHELSKREMLRGIERAIRKVRRDRRSPVRHMLPNMLVFAKRLRRELAEESVGESKRTGR